MAGQRPLVTTMAPEHSSSPGLLVEHARALVEIEDSRFASAQARVTALLAVNGVIGGIGGSFLAGLGGRDYSSPVLIAAGALGAIAIGMLIWSAFLAVASLKKEPEPERQSKRLANIIKHRLPSLVDQPPENAAHSTLLPLLAKQHELIHKASEEIHEAFERATRTLGIAVASGLVMAVVIVLGAPSKAQEVRLVEESPKIQQPAAGRATLKRQ